MRRAELVRKLQTVPPFPVADASREQVVTPPELAAGMLEDALARGDLLGRHVLDLGCGTGVLSIGASLLGAERVTGVDSDARALDLARSAADRLGASVAWTCAAVEDLVVPADTVLMNPPFGAQRRHADRPFWAAALAAAPRRIHAFALADSRTFIARWAVAHSVRIEETRPVVWPLPATFPHHRKRRVELAVDRWVLGTAHER